MAKVLWHVTMSLDGFIAGPGDSMDWAFVHSAPNPTVDEVIQTTGAVLVGRRSLEVGKQATRLETGKPYGGAWKGPEFVLTHRPPEQHPDREVTFLSGDIRRAISTVLQAADGKNVVVIGAHVAQQCIDEGLIDELLVHVAPILLGDGIRLFGRPGALPIDLEATEVSRAGAITNLRFRVLPQQRGDKADAT
jgi:dihydrofolate reductase